MLTVNRREKKNGTVVVSIALAPCFRRTKHDSVCLPPLSKFLTQRGGTQSATEFNRAGVRPTDSAAPTTKKPQASRLSIHEQV